MAETKETRREQPGQTERGLTPRQGGREGIQRWSHGFDDPFEFMNRMGEEMDRTFDRLWRDFGIQRRRSWQPQALLRRGSGRETWAPTVEAFQKGDQFVVRAELPGLKKDDVELELRDDALAIRGERRDEREEEREGYFHSERQYGAFYRVIPLPEGVIGESAKATFHDGVLEVSMQAAPSETSRGRKLEIKEETNQKK